MRALLVMRYLSSKDTNGDLIHHEKKFEGQIQALRNLGYNCTYFIVSEGYIYKFEDDRIVSKKRLYFSRIPVVGKFVVFKSVFHEAKIAARDSYDFIYVRNSPFVYEYYRALKQFGKSSSKVVVSLWFSGN